MPGFTILATARFERNLEKRRVLPDTTPAPATRASGRKPPITPLPPKGDNKDLSRELASPLHRWLAGSWVHCD